MLLVAELGSLHKRNESLAHEMIRQAWLAGCDIAKFQLGWPADDEVRHIDNIAGALKEWCDSYGIEFMASVWNHDALRLAERLGVKRHKIANQLAIDPVHHNLIMEVLATGKPTFISGAMVGSTYQNAFPIYCEGKYPTYKPEIPLHFNSWWGYSSHTHGIADALIAVSRGARYIEKHFTLDPTDLWVRDTPFAIGPDEMRQLAILARQIERLR